MCDINSYAINEEWLIVKNTTTSYNNYIFIVKITIQQRHMKYGADGSRWTAEEPHLTFQARSR